MQGEEQQAHCVVVVVMVMVVTVHSIRIQSTVARGLDPQVSATVDLFRYLCSQGQEGMGAKNRTGG